MGGAPQVGAARLRDTVATTALSVRGCASCLLINLLFSTLIPSFCGPPAPLPRLQWSRK